MRVGHTYPQAAEPSVSDSTAQQGAVPQGSQAIGATRERTTTKVIAPNTDAHMLTEQMSQIISSGHLGPRSLFALKFGAEAARTDGIAGVLSIKIPLKERDFVDIVFTVGTVDVIARWGESA